MKQFQNWYYGFLHYAAKKVGQYSVARVQYIHNVTMEQSCILPGRFRCPAR